jgi:hypothetical protein
VQRDADEQMCAGVPSEQLHIDHVRDPRQRMPIGLVDMCEGPLNARPRETTEHVRIVRDITRVIEIDEYVRADLDVNCEDKDKQCRYDEKAGARSGRQRSNEVVWYLRSRTRTASLFTTRSSGQ